MKLVTFNKNALIYKEGDISDKVYFIKSGEV